jgi:hypothetical protein
MRKIASEIVHKEMGMLNNAMSQISLVWDKYILCKNYFEMIGIAKFSSVNGLSYTESQLTICLVIRCVSTYVGKINQLTQDTYILYKNYIEMIEIAKFNFVNGFSYRESKQAICLVVGCVATNMGTINRDPLSCMQDNPSCHRWCSN